MCVTQLRDYPGEAGSIGAGRDFVAALVVTLLDPRGWAVADDAALLVSELVTSAVEASCRHVEVRAAVHVDAMEITVIGRGPGDPSTSASAASAGTVPPLRARLLDGLAGDVRLHRKPDGTLVGAARLPCRRSWTAGVPCERSGLEP
jgi:hypothetical protein